MQQLYFQHILQNLTRSLKRSKTTDGERQCQLKWTLSQGMTRLSLFQENQSTMLWDAGGYTKTSSMPMEHTAAANRDWSRKATIRSMGATTLKPSAQ